MKTIGIRALRENPAVLSQNALTGDFTLITNHSKPISLAIPFSAELLELGIHVLIAIKLFEEGIITLSRAAKLANLPITAFLEKLAILGTTVVEQDQLELEQDLKILNKVVVADTGPLIALAICDFLAFIPQLLGQVYLSQAVYQEATVEANKPGTKHIIDALEHKLLHLENIILEDRFTGLIGILDQGEAEAIALALKLNATLLIDEKKGRRVAQQYNIPLTGSAAVLILAKKMNLIKEVKPKIETLISHGYRFSTSLINEIL